MASAPSPVGSTPPLNRIDVRRRKAIGLVVPAADRNCGAPPWRLAGVKSRRREAFEISALVALALVFFATCMLIAFGGVAAARAASASVTLPSSLQLNAIRLPAQVNEKGPHEAALS